MARKAVQGYPEKSYYDNTRYLGIVATTDPLNEGLFKHMVNFDVSDTGQSVEPRDGFLTTVLKNANHISLSNNTIIYKDNTLGDYILFDLTANVAYIADITAYNVPEYYLPIKSVIANKNWDELFKQVLIPNVSYVAAYRNTTTLENTITQFKNKIKPVPDTKIEHIYDENGISRALVKVTLNTNVNGETPFNFILQLRYRQTAIGPFAADTLIIEGLPYMFEHPTLAPSERNLAVAKSIIPENFQTLYTQATRPDGHISSLGNFIYIYNDQEEYINNFIFKNINYNIKPYFTLNPAYVDLNNEPGSTDKWAYKFEIFNSSADISSKDKEIIFKSPWMKYSDKFSRPVEIFPKGNRDSVISLTASNRQLRHYKGARYTIFVMPKDLVPSVSSRITTNGVVTETFPRTNQDGDFDPIASAPFFLSYNDLINRQNNWITEINKVNDIKTLIKTITDLGTNALFYLYDIQETPSAGIYKTFDDSMNGSSNYQVETHIIEKNNSGDLYNIFLNDEELITRIKNESIYSGENKDIVFKLLPFGSNDTRLEAETIVNFTSSTLFGTQSPYFSSTIPAGSSEAIGTIIQHSNSPYTVYRYINQVGGGTTWSSLGTGVATTVNFVAGNYYYDERTEKYYLWEEATGKTGRMTPVTTVPSSQKITYRWVFSELNYWKPSDTDNTVNPYVDYINVYNHVYNNTYGFFEYDWNKLEYILKTDLNTLESTSGSSVTEFVSSALFHSYGTQQPPYYCNADPNGTITAAFNTVIQRTPFTVSGTTISPIYRQTTSPSGNTWTAINSSGTPPATSFIQNSLYKDTRTGFFYKWNNATGYTGYMTPISLNKPNLEALGFFDKNVSGIFYIRPYEESEIADKDFQELETIKVAWGAAAFTQTFNVTYGYDDLSVTYIDKELDIIPGKIQSSDTMTIFEDSRLLLWKDNVLYISEEGKFYWFKERNRIEFSEEIVKVLQFKTIILVFTTQHLYAVYRVETLSTQLNTATNQIEQNVTGSAWLKQIVLYNLLVKKEYKDVIQIFNQMILFYSEDGQLFMIRPSNTIDSETRFSIQFFNKAANDILKNYEVYINERLASYGSPMRIIKNEVKIKALVSINFIKIFYYVPGVITYMLIYDVINNRYTAYDTLTFTNIFDKWFIESGDLFITEQNNKLYFTFPYVEQNIRDNHVDMTFTNNFKKEGINCLIDTGNLNLNNHLYKRFRDLHVTFKNLNASNVLFNLETMIDEIVAKPFYNQQLQVIDSNNISYYVTVSKANDKDLIELVDVNMISALATDVIKYSLTNNLFENNNILMDFSEYTSSKLLTHRTSILGLGKVFRIKLQFISKGLYKLQNFGIIYKERRV